MQYSKTSSTPVKTDFSNPDRLVMSPDIIYVEHVLKDAEDNEQDYTNTIYNFGNIPFTSVSNIMSAKVNYNVNDSKQVDKINVVINSDIMKTDTMYTVPTIIEGVNYKFILRKDAKVLDCYMQKLVEDKEPLPQL